MKIEKYKEEYFNQINKIFVESFPVDERYKSMGEFVINVKKDEAELYCLLEEKEVQGFMYLIKLKNMVFILYLAIDKNKRSSGYGSYMLNWCLDKYSDQKIYLNIEEVNEKFDDYEIRKKRLKFYLKNKLYLLDYMSIEEDVCFNILSNQEHFDINEYELLDKLVAKVVNDKPSKIEKIR